MKTTIQKTLWSILILCSSFSAMAQTGTIKGTIETSDGKPAEYVNVGLKGTNKGTSVNEKGEYEIKNVDTGKYTLVASFMGLESREQQVEVRAGQTTVVPQITLKENTQQLHVVIVNANSANKFANKPSDDLAKMPLKDLENSQAYTTVTGDLMQEQMTTNLGEALQNVPGITPLFTGLYMGGGDVSSYYSSRGFNISPTLRNGVSTASIADLDPANIEDVEMLKGPAGTLFGSTLVSWGGLINIVTKQPYGSFGGEVSYTVGSYGLNRFTADVNVPLNKDSTILFRLNAAYTYQGSFEDAGFTKSTFLAPTITYKPNDRLTISLEGELYQQQGTTSSNIFIFYPMNVSSPTGLNLAYTKSFTSNQIVFNSPTTSFFGQVKYKLSDHWTSQTLLSTTTGTSSGPIEWENFTSGNGDSLVRNITDGTQTITTTEIQQNFISDYTWGKIRNRLVAGVDFYYYYNNNSYYYLPFDTVSVSNPGTEYFNLTPSAISAKEATEQYGPYVDIDNEYTYAAYASDVFNLTDNLIANAGLRLDHFDQQGDLDASLGSTGPYQQTALSPKFGLVYQPVKNRVALFANYLNGFQNNSGADFYGKPFKASNGNQFEAGVKLDIFKHKLSATLSYYDIYASDLLETDPNHPQFSIQDGIERSQGTEVSIIATPVAGLDVIAGYSYNDALYIQNYGVTGLRPSEAGPANTANLYASYHLLTGKVKGLGFSFGVNYASENTDVNQTPAEEGVFTLPAYTVLNASVFYDKPKYRLGLKVDNITNKEYWIGWYDMQPQMPRSVSATVAVKF